MTNSNIPTVARVIKPLFELAPKWLAEDFDFVGLQVGRLDKRVRKVLVTLDVRQNTVEEAIAADVDLIIAHHPLLFKPLRPLDVATPKGKVVAELIKHDITVVAAHTNLDKANGGMNDWLAAALHLQNVTGLTAPEQQNDVTLTITMPASVAPTVINQLVAASGVPQTSFVSSGRSARTQVTSAQTQLQLTLTAAQLAKTRSLLAELQTTPELSYQITPLASGTPTYSLGRIGTLKEALTPQALSDRCCATFDLSLVKLAVAPATPTIKTIAVLGGSGGSLARTVQARHVDAYITGDISYHVAQDLAAAGVNVLDVGHHVEAICIKQLTQWYQQVQHENAWAITVLPSQANTDPFTYVTAD